LYTSTFAGDPQRIVPVDPASGVEQVVLISPWYVLFKTDGVTVLQAGSAIWGGPAVVINPPGTRHSVSSDEGCIVLAIWQAPVRFL